MARMATICGVFPLYEVHQSEYRLSVIPDPIRPVSDYLQSQGRFKQVGADMADAMQKQIDKRWCWLQEKTKIC
jgi:pyruvate/2-oxoacid:ferredoxin oxidoreductase beta subunit